MLKFATKKPPRLKQSTLNESEGQLYSGEGEGRFVGNISKYGELSSVEDSVDSGINQSVDFLGVKPHVDYDGLHGNKEHVGYPGYRSKPAHSPINEKWKAFNVKYGKIGVEKEIEIPFEVQPREVGMSRNGHVYEGQRSHYNPGYRDNTMTIRPESNLHKFPLSSESRVYPRGSGYEFSPPGTQGQMSRSSQPGQSYSSPRPNFYVPGSVSSHSVNVDNYGIYGQPYSLDSTTSLSLDSVSTLGDPSSKSPSEYLDYDTLMDTQTSVRRGIDDKPPTVPHKHRHVHIGRGTHGLCEGSSSPVRPGSTDSQITSSLRKSPGYKSGHHVRWGPGVVNSGHKEPDVPVTLQTSSPNKKAKKKTSLRTLLNLPKFPVKDEDLTDHGSDLDQRSECQTRAISKKKKGSKQTSGVKTRATPAAELASLQYKKEFSASETDHLSKILQPANKNVPKLNMTHAQIPSIFSLPISTQSFSVHHGKPEQTTAITQPIMHIGKQESPNKGQVNSVRPFLVTGQTDEIQDYDNCNETQPQTSKLISVRQGNLNKSGVFSPSSVTASSQFNVKNSQKVDVLNEYQMSSQNIPVTFDTFVTLGRPSERNVIFDTFVTLGRPYATSTPVPNGSYQGSVQYLGSTSINKTSGSNLNYITSAASSSQFSASGGQVSVSSQQFITTNITGNKTKSTSVLRPTSVPIVSQVIHKDTRVPIMRDQRLEQGMLGRGHVRSSGPYEMDNRNYGKLSSPPSTFITWTQGSVGHPDNANVRTWQSHDQMTSHDKIGFHGNQLAFKDRGTYRERESQDYDDDVFMNLMSSLTGPSSVQTGQVKCKLDFEGVSRKPDKVCQICMSCLVSYYIYF